MNALKKMVVLLLFVLISSFTSQSFAATGLNCGGPTIKANDSPYSSVPAIQGVTIDDIVEVRVGALTAAAGAYRTVNGFGSLPTGSMFKMVYSDLSKECGEIISPISSVGAGPVVDSQRGPPGGGSGGGGELTVNGRVAWAFPWIGFYQICFDYYSDGQFIGSVCDIHLF